ncbi:MAG: hypothetical protein ACXVQJ_01725 [Actinomycetota bacterium]
MAGNGRHSGRAATRRRNRMIAAIAAVGIVAFASGFLLASRGGSEAAAPSASATASPSPSPSPPHSPRPSRSATASPIASPTPDATATPPAGTLPPGRNFGLILGATGTPPGAVTLRFDAARFLTGGAADKAAAAHGDPTPVPNGYYIVNDDPTPQKVSVDPSVEVRYIPENMCCELQRGTFAGFLAAAQETAMTDYPHIATTYWWLSVRDGRVVKIEQQYLP